MTKISLGAHPYLLGFDQLERLVERASKGAEGYPPYNIERIHAGAGDDRIHADAGGGDTVIRITLAVAGFGPGDLDITTEENQLTIRGSQADQKDRDFLYRGIASRQFQRSFLFADGMRILGAELRNGLLSIDLARPKPERVVKKIDIVVAD